MTRGPPEPGGRVRAECQTTLLLILIDLAASPVLRLRRYLPPLLEMPPKAHRPGLSRTHSHSRTSSGNGSKVALNLHFTQKDPAPSKGEKGRRNGHDVRHSPRKYNYI